MKHNQYTFEGQLEQLEEFAVGARSRFGRRRRVLIVIFLLGPMVVSLIVGTLAVVGMFG